MLVPIFVGGLPDDAEILAEGEGNTIREEPEVKKDKVDDKEEGLEEKEEKLEEEIEEESDEEESEDIAALYARPSIKAINEKFPELFKTFPELKDAFFREKKFTEFFPTVEDAEEAYTKSEDFDNFSGLLYSGDKKDLTTFLSSVEEGNKGTLKSIASNFLSVLYETDKDAYVTAVDPLLENVIRSVFNTGVSRNSENMQNAARIFSRFIFNDDAIAEGKKTTVIRSEEEKVDPEKAEMKLQRYNDVQKRVTNNCQKFLKKAIIKDFNLGDDFSDDISDILVDRIMSETDNHLKGDERHMKIMNSLWKKAMSAGFVGDGEARIISTYLARAKAVMPAIRARIRAKALNQKVDSSEKKVALSKESSKEMKQSGKVSNGITSKTVQSKDVDWGKTSDMDFLNDRVILKKG